MKFLSYTIEVVLISIKSTTQDLKEFGHYRWLSFTGTSLKDVLSFPVIRTCFVKISFEE